MAIVLVYDAWYTSCTVPVAHSLIDKIYCSTIAPYTEFFVAWLFSRKRTDGLPEEAKSWFIYYRIFFGNFTTVANRLITSEFEYFSKFITVYRSSMLFRKYSVFTRFWKSNIGTGDANFTSDYWYDKNDLWPLEDTLFRGKYRFATNYCYFDTFCCKRQNG